MLSIVTYKWKPASGYRSCFGAETVNVLKRMVDRHYPDPHGFICCTDDANGIDKDIEIVPLWNDFANVPSPHGGKNPSCYRRLKHFSAEIASVFGQRFVALDLDCVIVGDMRPVWNRPEDFVMVADSDPARTHLKGRLNGSMTLMTAGSRRQVWERFNPQTSPQLSLNGKCFGSDQGWISYCLGPGETRWGTLDGVYSFRNHLRNGADPLPENARIVMFHGSHDPWGDRAQRLSWVREFYR